MAEVTKYCCCTNNLTGCKIIGGVQIALYAMMLIAFCVLTAFPRGDMTLAIFVFVVLGLEILSAIFLIVAASKRSATMLLVWMVLNGIGIGVLLLDIFLSPQNFISKLPGIALAIWAEIIADGARQEVKSEENIVIEAGQELKSGRYI